MPHHNDRSHDMLVLRKNIDKRWCKGGQRYFGLSYLEPNPFRSHKISTSFAHSFTALLLVKQRRKDTIHNRRYISISGSTEQLVDLISLF